MYHYLSWDFESKFVSPQLLENNFTFFISSPEITLCEQLSSLPVFLILVMLVQSRELQKDV